MGRHYMQLGIEERCELARLYAQGCSLRQIATSLDRAPSTITRELKRNTSRQQGYRPTYAQEQARARRWGGARLDRAAALRAQGLARLKQGWSPEQIAGRFRRDAGRTILAPETIHRFIYAQTTRTTRTKQGRAWRHYLPRAKWQRGRRRRRRSPAALIQDRHPLRERPAAATDRQPPGPWEADLMLFRTYGQAVLTGHERHSRLLLAVRPPGKAATPIAQAQARLLGPLPAPWRQTVVTFDNGAEFARHHELHALGIETFCCDTQAPWQKGGLKTPSGACGAGCPARPTWRPYRRSGLWSWCSCTITRPASVWPTGRPRKSSGTTCCTSNVNPPSRVSGE